MNENVTTIERQDLFRILCHEAVTCHQCPRMVTHAASMSRYNGTLIPKVLFLGEAPARIGADLHRGLFGDDQTQAKFDELLASIDLSRDEVFVTTSVLCCTADNRHDTRPSLEEVRNCSRFLSDTLRLLAPPVVVTLGTVALRAVCRLIDQPLVLADTVGTVVECDDFLVVPLYAPDSHSLRSTRSIQQQKADFAAVREAIAWTTLALV